MVKSVFVGLAEGGLDKILDSGANHLMVAMSGLNKSRWQILVKTDIQLSISLNAFDQGGCPLDPKAKERLLKRVKKAFAFNPAEIWLDHFRFDGHWEAIKDSQIPEIHQECQWCLRQDRPRALVKIAEEVKKIIPKNIGLGYFAVPFKEAEVPELISGLGQDHRQLAKIFAIISPMLYHRMIKKPIKYIHDYVVWLHQQTKKAILPIIQVKDMPDELPNKLSEEEIILAFQEAIKPPSCGVAFFCWRHALEKRKAQLIKKLFKQTE